MLRMYRSKDGGRMIRRFGVSRMALSRSRASARISSSALVTLSSRLTGRKRVGHVLLKTAGEVKDGRLNTWPFRRFTDTLDTDSIPHVPCHHAGKLCQEGCESTSHCLSYTYYGVVITRLLYINDHTLVVCLFYAVVKGQQHTSSCVTLKPCSLHA